LMYWELLPLFSRFLKALGFEVVLSGKTDKRIIRMGVESVTAQPCFPVKVAYGHIAELIERKVDYIFLPSIVSMTAHYPQNQHNQLCPYVQSLAYQVQTAFVDKLGQTKILSAPIRLGEGQKLLRKTFSLLGKKLGLSSTAVYGAIKEGLAAQAAFEMALKEKGKEILAKTAPDQKLFVLVSRPYNGCDEGLSLELPKKLAELGVETIPMDMLDLHNAPLGDKLLHQELYWTSGQKILRAAEIIKQDTRLFAVYLSNFSCGPDSFLLSFFKDVMARKPCLQLELDEHSADAGVITRLEAFLESLKHYCPAHKGPQALASPDTKAAPAIKTRADKSIGSQRRLYIPYMGDCSYGIAACFRAYGQQAEVMPMADESALLQGREFTTGKECLPCAITTGDMIKLVKTEGFEPSRAAFFMPGSSGPCRFGMYNCMHRLVLKQAGAPDVDVISPNQDVSFYRQLAKSVNVTSVTGLIKEMWIAVVGIDLLYKLILRLRPFAKDPDCAQQTYQQSVKRWVQAVEARKGLSGSIKLMDSIAAQFDKVELDRVVRKPRIGIVGEIYVRSHPFANMNIIARLEQLGAACDLAPLAEWIYYTNFTRGCAAKRKRQLRDFFSNSVQNWLQHKIERALALPLEKRFGPLAEKPIEHTIKLAQPYLHRSFEGEAILSVGKIIEYFSDGLGGVVNVMPFTCMPSTIVSSQTMCISAHCNGMPILNLSFDGQEDSTLTTRLEAFVEQVRQRRDASLSLAELIEV
jgi:predicted nucleotide-binding protein (sugar kinase/HSP70/actin superfamily)